MAILYLDGIKPTDKIQARAEWRVTLVADAGEITLFASFPAAVDRWLDGLNGTAYPSSVVTYQSGKLVAVVDIRIIPLAVEYGTVADVTNRLDTMVPGIDVREIRAIESGETNLQGDVRREAIRNGSTAPSVTGIGAAVDKAVDAGQEASRDFLDKLGEILGVAKDVLLFGLILAGLGLAVYGVTKAKALKAAVT
jgi:hypothetical protein